MFENLTSRLSRVLDSIRGQGRLTEDQINAAARELRMALLEADVALPVVKDFVDHVKERALGVEITQSLTLLWIGIAGVAVGVAYTAPPLKLVYRGLGEIAVAIGFGPIMLLGAYVVQTGELAWEPFVLSLVPGLLIALILYVNEIPDRRSDAEAGKRTLPVRLSPNTVRTGYLVAAMAAFAIILGGVVGGLFPWPTVAALAAVPIALRVHAGLKVHYDSPYTLMAVMGTNVNLNLVAGGLLLIGYVVAIIVSAVA